MMHTRHLCCILLMAICRMGLSCHASSLYSHPDNPYAVTHIQDAYGAHYNFHWDDNGNLVNSHTHATHTDRRLCWTEDEAAQSERRASLLAFPSQSSVGVANRLQAFMERGDEGGIAAYYNYSADGERNIKLTSPRLNIQQNASLFSNPPLVYPTLYASSLVTLTKQGYTKHYFEECCRICSKIGGGMQGNVTVEEIDSRVPELTYNYDDQFRHQYDGIRHTFSECVDADPQIIDGVNLHRMLIEREVQRDNDEPAFFYHDDHLGSTSYLTDDDGYVTQTLNYLPYGEDWVDLQNHFETRYPLLGVYAFNGKEKDYESGFVSALSAGLVQQFMVNYMGIRVNVIAGCRVRGLNTNVRELSINYLSLSDMDLRWR